MRSAVHLEYEFDDLAFPAVRCGDKGSFYFEEYFLKVRSSCKQKSGDFGSSVNRSRHTASGH